MLVVSGGYCHDYARQRRLLERVLKERLSADVTHLHYDPRPGEKATRPALPIYGNPHYADGYDVVIHNECAADEDSAAVLDTVLAPHRKGIPAVNLHCAMHSYRSGAWKHPVNDVTPVLTGVQPDSGIEADRARVSTVAWTRTYGPKQARVFSTTLAHNTARARPVSRRRHCAGVVATAGVPAFQSLAHNSETADALIWV